MNRKLAICLFFCVASNQTYAQQQRLKPGIYVPNDTVFQRICGQPAGPDMLPFPMVVTKDHIYQLGRIRFTGIEQLTSYIIRNKDHILEHSSINKIQQNNGQMTICIKYPFIVAGERTKYYDTWFSGRITGDSIINYKMVEPYPPSYYRRVHKRMNNNFTYELTPKTMIYKAFEIEELAEP